MDQRPRVRWWRVAVLGGLAALACFGGLPGLGVGEPYRSIAFLVFLMVLVGTEVPRWSPTFHYQSLGEASPREARRRLEKLLRDRRFWLEGALWGGLGGLACHGGLAALGVGEPWPSIAFFVLLMVMVRTQGRRCAGR